MSDEGLKQVSYTEWGDWQFDEPREDVVAAWLIARGYHVFPPRPASPVIDSDDLHGKPFSLGGIKYVVHHHGGTWVLCHPDGNQCVTVYDPKDSPPGTR